MVHGAPLASVIEAWRALNGPYHRLKRVERLRIERPVRIAPVEPRSRRRFLEAAHHGLVRCMTLARIEHRFQLTRGMLQIARELKEIAPELPIFLLTPDNYLDIEKEALSCGITAVFSKQDMATLLANARSVCGFGMP